MAVCHSAVQVTSTIAMIGARRMHLVTPQNRTIDAGEMLEALSSFCLFPAWPSGAPTEALAEMAVGSMHAPPL